MVQRVAADRRGDGSGLTKWEFRVIQDDKQVNALRAWRQGGSVTGMPSRHP